MGRNKGATMNEIIKIKGLPIKALDKEGRECLDYSVTFIGGMLYGVINDNTTGREIVELRVTYE